MHRSGAAPVARFCTACGSAQAAPPCSVCGADANGNIGAGERLAGRLNWGAFFLPGLWTFWHGRPAMGVAWWCLAVLTAFVPAAAIAALVLALYLLVRGNRIALQRRRFRDVADFLRVERYWARWGIGVAIASLAVAAAVIGDANAIFGAVMR